MTEKRFTNHITKTDADGTIHSDGILDANEDNKIIITNYFYIASLLNKLNDENEQLKQELFESEKEYLIETYSDNSVRKNDKIHSLKKEFKERFGRDFE